MADFAFLKVAPDTYVCGSGNFESSPGPPEKGVAFYVNDFGLSDPEPLVRDRAIYAAELLPLDQTASSLTPLLNDPVPYVRINAARVLSGIANQLFADRL